MQSDRYRKALKEKNPYCVWVQGVEQKHFFHLVFSSATVACFIKKSVDVHAICILAGESVYHNTPIFRGQQCPE